MQDEIMDKPDVAATAADGLSRRRFLTYAGALAGAGIFAASCNKDDDDNNVVPSPTEETVNLGTGDAGVMNYFLALEQMAAYFYAKVCATPYVGIEKFKAIDLFRDVLAHTQAHRELYKNMLGSEAIEDLVIEFKDVDFENEVSVLETAIRVSDILVMAYNGAMNKLIANGYLSITGKISSVKARHSAFIRDTYQFGSFADVTDGYGMDTVPTDYDTVLGFTRPYFKKKLLATNLSRI